MDSKELISESQETVSLEIEQEEKTSIKKDILSSFEQEMEEKQPEIIRTIDIEDNDRSVNNLTNNAAAAHAARMLSNGDGFANVFLHEWQLAIKRVDTGRRLMESLQTFMRERAQLEEMYAAGLEKLANKLTVPQWESAGVVSTVTAVQSDAMRRAQQATELSESIKLDIIKSTLSTTIQNHYNVLRQINSDATSISRSLTNSVTEVRKAERDVARLGREAFQTAREGQQMTKLMSSQQTRLATKRRCVAHFRALTQIHSLQAAETHYRRAVQIANDTKRIYSSQMKVILRSLEDMDLKRLACFKDALRKLMVYQTSVLRNVQYDLDLTIQAIEELSEKSEVELFVTRGRDTLGLQRVDEEKCIIESQSPSVSLSASSSKPSDSQSTPPTSSPQSVIIPTDFETVSQQSLKHWALLCLSPSTTDDSTSPPPSSGRRSSTTSISVESATTVARNLLKKTPLDKVVQSAAAHLSSMGISSSTTTSNDSSSQHPTPTALLTTSTSDIPPDPEVLLWLSGESTDSEAVRRSNLHEASVAKIRTGYDELLNLIWDFTPELSKSLWTGTEKLKEDLSSSLNRAILCQSLDAKREEEKYQLPNMDSLRILGFLVETSLEWCERQWDVVTARALMVLVQKFYAKGKPSDDPQGNGSVWIWPHLRDMKKNDKEDEIEMTCDPGKTENVQEKVIVLWFLHRVLYHIVLWNRVHFWEEALVFTISQTEQQKLLKESEEAVNKALGTTSIVPSTNKYTSTTLYDGLLEQFGACMIAFGILESQVIALIQKICREQNLSSDFTICLLNCIANRRDQGFEIMLPMAPFEALAHPVTDPSSFSNEKFHRASIPNLSEASENGPLPHLAEASVNGFNKDEDIKNEVTNTEETLSQLGRHEIFDD